MPSSAIEANYITTVIENQLFTIKRISQIHLHSRFQLIVGSVSLIHARVSNNYMCSHHQSKLLIACTIYEEKKKAGIHVSFTGLIGICQSFPLPNIHAVQ